METLTESDDNSGYNSDQIDSDIEVRLYGAIHHSMPTDSPELVTDWQNSVVNTPDIHPKADLLGGGDEDWTQNKMKSINETTNESTKPLKPLINIFRLLDQKLDESDCEFDEDFDFNVPNDSNVPIVSNKRKIELIEISDSSDNYDSDIAIIEDKTYRTLGNKSETKTKSVVNSPKGKAKVQSVVKSPNMKSKVENVVKSPKVRPKTDISLGNVSNLDESAVSAMNQFYDEDVYDSEEEVKSFNSMTEDKSYWKINYNDLLLSRKESNRYYKNRFICNNCNERGHQSRECPLPKKSPTCYLCGLTGHRSDRCKSILCSRCLSNSHRTMNCRVLVNELICEECGDRGHDANQCTYNWRKYHSTTDSTPKVTAFSNLSLNERKCCYNCGQIGKHFGFECRSKSMTKHVIPVSPLMLDPRKSHCFNGRERNERNRSWNECNQKAFSNEFVKSISSNELSCLSASFNKPLDESDLCHTSATPTTAHSSNNKNKHIKWIYTDSNGTDSPSYVRHSSPIEWRRNCQKNVAIGEQRDDRIFNDCSPLSNPSTDASALYTHSAHAPHTHTPTLQQINNSMLEKKSQTQTTPQLNERSKRNNKRKKKEKRKQRLLSETNITQNQINGTSNQVHNPKPKSKNRFKRFRNWKNKKIRNNNNNNNNNE